MRDVDELIRALQGPEPPPAAPPWPRTRRPRRVAIPLIALAAGLVLWFASRPEGPRVRGIGSEVAVDLDLRMVVERGGIATRIATGSPLRVGERVLFRGAASRETPVVLWVSGPAGRERITETHLGSTATDLGDAGGLVGYRFDEPGRYVFSLSTGPVPPCTGCPSLRFEVVP